MTPTEPHQEKLATSAEDTAIAVVDPDNHVAGLVTVDSVLGWVAAGGGAAEQVIAPLVGETLPAVTLTSSGYTCVTVVFCEARVSKLPLLVKSHRNCTGWLDDAASALSVTRTLSPP